MIFSKEGHIETKGGKVWYGIAGEQTGKTPLLVIHGGPGFPSYYLEPLAALADERQVIFYDQLGCGRSNTTSDTKFFTIENYLEELAVIRRELGLDKVHIFSHSWGTMLLTDYFLTAPEGIESVVFSSPAISAPLWVKTMQGYLDEMPNGLGHFIRDCDKRGDVKNPSYKEALKLFYETYECRLLPWPACLIKSDREIGLPYRYMWGNEEYLATGVLRDYDRTRMLSRVRVPVLITCGRYDGCSPESAEIYRSHLPQAKVAVFENSAHMAHIEENHYYLKVIRDFLSGVEC